jgi:hypothetical protein
MGFSLSTYLCVRFSYRYRAQRKVHSFEWVSVKFCVHQIPEFIIGTQTEGKMGRGTIWATYVHSCQPFGHRP